MTTSHQYLQDLQEHLERGQLALFIGADLSSEVTGLPSRTDLARELARRKGLDGSLSLAQAAQRVGRAGNRWEFTAFIRDNLDAAGKPPQPFHLRVVELVNAHQIETLITTAYDNLLELAFQQAGVGLNRVVRGSDAGFIDPDRPTLIKLYGDAQQPDTLIVTEDDHYGLWRDRDKEDLLDMVRTAMRQKTILFLGYNLADPDFNLLWREVLDRAGRFARTAYAVWPGLPENDAQMWRDRGIQIMEVDPLGTLAAAPSTRPQSSPASVPTAPDPHLLRQLEHARENLRLIEERKGEYVLEVDVPLQLVKEERRLRERIADLEAQLGITPVVPEVPKVPTRVERPTSGRTTTHIGHVEGPVHTGSGDIVLHQPTPSPRPSRTEPAPPEEIRAPATYFDMQVRIQGFDDEAQGYPVEVLLGDGSHFEGGIFRLDRELLLTTELDPQAYGLTLFDALFSGPMLRAYDRAAVHADLSTEGRLRFRLWIDNDAAELHALTWERLHHRVQSTPLPIATSGEMPFSRYVGLAQREPTPIVERPVRMLVAVANPTNLSDYALTPLDVEGEIENLIESLRDLQQTEQLQVTLMPGCTGLPEALHTQLEGSGYQVQQGATRLDAILRLLTRGGGYHILHFLGHGRFSRRIDTAALFLEDADGKVQLIKDENIVTRLASAGSLPHLVFLAACESAKRDSEEQGASNPFVGLAPKLIQVGVPAVVAMQDLISTTTARKLARNFYSYLLEHGIVDRAMNQARLMLLEPGRADWAIPVLFMRLKQGQLFS